MKHLKKFENVESPENEPLEEESSEMRVKVKHLIQYLSRFDREMEVGLDKDGWWIGHGINPKDELDLIEQRGLFQIWDDYMIIQN